MARIFITGATGYVGGEVLQLLAKSHSDLIIRALVRDDTKAAAVSAVSDSVEVVNGTLDDVDIIAREAANADVVLNLAAAGHVKSAEAIYKTLSRQIAKGEKAAHWVQISGASALSAVEYTDDSFVYGSASNLVFDDLNGANEFRAYIQRYPVRTLDNYVVTAAAQTPDLRVAHILPPIIYGEGRGPVNRRSVQVPELARITLLRKRGVRIGTGLNRWGAIHVRDLGQLFLLLVEDALNTGAKHGVWGADGIYLPSDSEWAFKDVISRIIDAADEQGFIKTHEVDELARTEIDDLLHYGSMIYGTNARFASRRGQEILGWEIHEKGLEVEIPRAVALEAKTLAGKVDK